MPWVRDAILGNLGKERQEDLAKSAVHRKAGDEAREEGGGERVVAERAEQAQRALRLCLCRLREHGWALERDGRIGDTQLAHILEDLAELGRDRRPLARAQVGAAREAGDEKVHHWQVRCRRQPADQRAIEERPSVVHIRVARRYGLARGRLGRLGDKFVGELCELERNVRLRAVRGRRAARQLRHQNDLEHLGEDFCATHAHPTQSPLKRVSVRSSGQRSAASSPWRTGIVLEDERYHPQPALALQALARALLD